MTEHFEDRARRAEEARRRVTHASADEALAPGARTVVDVRDPAEYDADHLDGALNLPVDELEERAAELLPDRDAPVVTYCNGGGRGSLGADTLTRLGYTDVVNLEGGLRGLRGQGS